MFATLVAFLAAVAASVALPRDHLNLLAIRQDVPGECAAQCIPVNAVIASQCTVSKCCSADFANAYVDCVECFANAIQLSNLAPFQNALDTLFASCSRADQPIPKLTLPGQNANRNIPSTSATITRSQTISLPPSSQRPSATGEITPVASPSSIPRSPTNTLTTHSSQVTTASPATGSASATPPLPATTSTAPPNALTTSSSAVGPATSQAAGGTQPPAPNTTSPNAAPSVKAAAFNAGVIHLVAIALAFVNHIV